MLSALEKLEEQVLDIVESFGKSTPTDLIVDLKTCKDGYQE